MTLRDKAARLEELGNAPGQIDPIAANKSGDTQGLSRVAEMADESVQELAEAGQTYEAEAVEGLEDAADYPEQPAHTHEDNTRPSALEPRTGAGQRAGRRARPATPRPPDVDARPAVGFTPGLTLGLCQRPSGAMSASASFGPQLWRR